jgi:hypothetical protein
MNGSKDASDCCCCRKRFSEYMDGRLTGREMLRIAGHLERCADCRREWSELEHTQALLARLGPAAAPSDLLLRIRVAVGQERARREKDLWTGWKLVWANTVGPFLLRAAGGFASAVLLLGTVILLFNFFAQPESARAMADEPLGSATGPRFLYMSSVANENPMESLRGPVVVEAYVNDSGAVYDYRIVSGPKDAATRTQVETLMLWSRFEPARRFGRPVAGLAVLSFAGVSVRG